MKERPLFRDIKYVCEVLGRSPQTIKRWVKKGAFPRPCNHSEFGLARLGGTEAYMWTTDDLNNWYAAFTGKNDLSIKFF